MFNNLCTHPPVVTSLWRHALVFNLSLRTNQLDQSTRCDLAAAVAAAAAAATGVWRRCLRAVKLIVYPTIDCRIQRENNRDSGPRRMRTRPLQWIDFDTLIFRPRCNTIQYTRIYAYDYELHARWFPWQPFVICASWCLGRGPQWAGALLWKALLDFYLRYYLTFCYSQKRWKKASDNKRWKATTYIMGWRHGN
jgi:hypothetical protein